jgi:hypothetical protein
MRSSNGTKRSGKRRLENWRRGLTQTEHDVTQERVGDCQEMLQPYERENEEEWAASSTCRDEPCHDRKGLRPTGRRRGPLAGSYDDNPATRTCLNQLRMIISCYQLPGSSSIPSTRACSPRQWIVRIPRSAPYTRRQICSPQCIRRRMNTVRIGRHRCCQHQHRRKTPPLTRFGREVSTRALPWLLVFLMLLLLPAKQLPQPVVQKQASFGTDKSRQALRSVVDWDDWPRKDGRVQKRKDRRWPSIPTSNVRGATEPEMRAKQGLR